MATTRKKGRKIHRDAGTGRTVTEEYAKANPKTTVSETIPARTVSDDFKPIVSSNLEAAKYDESTRELIIRFKNGRAYKYPDVSPELYADLLAADSAGSFFATQIRNLSNERIEDWK